MGRLLDYIRSPEYAAKVQADAQAAADRATQRQREDAERDKHRRDNTVRETLNNLREEGWHETTVDLMPAPTYPDTGRIVLEHPVHDYALVCTYGIDVDSSDYPGDDAKIAWRKADIVEQTVFDVEMR
jgi:hypothetical protein